MADKGGCALILQRGVGALFEYKTPKIVHIKSKKIGMMSRSVQALVIAYVVGYVLVYRKGYQEADQVVSAVTVKVKGNALTNFTDAELANIPPEWRYLYRRVWDVPDLIVPPVENNAFFVTTNLVTMPDQTRGECPDVGVWNCSEHIDCPKGEASSKGESTRNKNT